MHVKPEQNYELAMGLWHGKPSGRLMWTTYFHGPQRLWAEEAGYEDGRDFLMQDLGCMEYAQFARGAEIRMPQVEVLTRQEGELRTREYRSPWGALTEVSKGGRLMQHRVRSPEDLRVLIKIWEHAEVAPTPEDFQKERDRARGRWPVVISMGPSPLQRMIQGDLSVEDFWYAMADYPALMERAFAAHQANMLRAYEIFTKLPADAFCQDENTSTTLISPAYYRKYSLGHIRQYAEIVHRAGKRFVVHMCGHLRDLMTAFPETDMNGIDCLTPPPVGNCEFPYAFAAMPSDFFCTGRFGSSLWYEKSRGEILANLAAILPHDIYRERAFVLGVTGDGMQQISLANIRLLRDCINEYERKDG